MWPLLIVLPICFACLSKPLRKDTDHTSSAIEKALVPKVVRKYERGVMHEQKVCARRCETAAQQISSTYANTDNIKEKFDSVFKKVGDDHSAYVIASTAPFEMKKERNLIWLAANNTGTLEGVLEILKQHNKEDQQMFFKRGLVNVYGLLVQQVLLWFNQQLYLTTEETLPEFICMIGAHHNYYKTRAEKFAQLEAMGPIPICYYPPVSKFCSTLTQYIFGFLFTFDPGLVYVNSLPSFNHITINKFEDTYMRLIGEDLDACKMEKIMGDEMFVAAQRVNNNIMEDFEQRYQNAKLAIEDHFDDQVPEDHFIDMPIDVEEVVQPSESVYQDAKAEDTVTTQSPEAVNTGKSRAAIMAQYKGNRQSRLEARFAKERSKHSQLVSKLRYDEKDDDDVRFLYTFKNPSSNSTFSMNQMQQMCKITLPASKRYEHSLFPGISASGATINFLCSLLVSGTPTYEGFLAAHKDLGGVFVEKRNGNKLFFFNEPISYHKTLHAPHESSRFDHRLYRMFYRNCGLHPYFFKLTE